MFLSRCSSATGFDLLVLFLSLLLQWNEAASAAIYEINAAAYAAKGDTASACLFRRAARLSLQSVGRWQTAAGDLQIIKNWFDPAQVRLNL